MISIERILVGVDLSHADRLVSETLAEHCHNAVERALKLARRTGASVTFMSVLEISEQALHLIEMREAPSVSPIEADATRVMQPLIDEAASQGVTADFVLAYGHCAEQMIKQVLRGDYSLLIIGGKRPRGMTEWFSGRTTTKLLRKCPVPVLVVKPTPDSYDGGILAADDFSDNAERVLDLAVSIARAFSLKLHVVHVLEQSDDAKLIYSGIPREAILQVEANQREAAEARINERISRTDARTLELGFMTHAERGLPERVIGEKITELEIEVLIMGTVGRSGLSALMLGNTAERLLKTAPCSLLVIKPEDFVSPIKLT